ncbi:DgyrCDS7711 [Dimorphilus gyrociliatus]|uniref:DgyrCDS7711 n=1 Tax=Dimorphilus gyrociliatus TaxID=2664684 RepID=A0A7I8VTL8_9ANNE|nr:DgyrCDS7711 [Dimorphilus gyrociliatus]
MAFRSTSSKREDVSIHLKAQRYINLKNAKEQTKKLEMDSRKMEERLKELKLAVNKEKEDRKRLTNGTDNGFWKSGQTGQLTTYAKDVLEQNNEKNRKKTKFTVLKEEIIEPRKASAETKKVPGTLAYIAQQGEGFKVKNFKGPKCGQCEMKGAQVTCLECGEDYCASCFASFHLRGALKKHRSAPIAANGARGNITPRTSAASERASEKSAPPPLKVYEEQNPNKLTLTEIDFKMNEPTSSKVENSLLDGVYDEKAAQDSFQEALKEWRGDETTPKQTSNSSSTSVEKKIAVSTTDCAIGTSDQRIDGKKKLEIKFSTNSHSGLSYAEKLLIKKHRRNQINFEERPANNEEKLPIHSDSNVKQIRSADRQREISSIDMKERVDFNSLYEAMKSTSKTPSEISVVDISSPLPIHSPSPPTPNSSRKRAFDPDPEYSSRRAIVTPFIEPIVDSPPPMTPEPVCVQNVEEPRLDQAIAESVDLRKEELEQLPLESSRKSRLKKLPTKTPRTPRTPRTARPPSRAEMAVRRKEMFGEGTLTKKPSGSLQEIANYADLVVDNPLFVYNDGEEKPAVRPKTAGKRISTAKDGSIEKWKISSHVYKIGPRSWRPDSSLANRIVENQMRDHMSDENNIDMLALMRPEEGEEETENEIKILSYKWSEQDPKKNDLKLTENSLSQSDFRTSSIELEQRPQSRSIVVDGDDMSIYDNCEKNHEDHKEDNEALNQLEWELASEQGLIDEDGKISRMQFLSQDEDEKDITPKNSFDLEKQLNEGDRLYDDFEEMEAEFLCEDEVCKLK